MNIIVTGNINKEKFNQILNDIDNFFVKYKSFTIFLDNYIKNSAISSSKKFISIYNSIPKIDFVISIGGDGAILSAIRRMKDKQLPILGIHIGNLGFLNKITDKNFTLKLHTKTSH